MSKIKIYKASAGSGKTYMLALEYIKCLLMSNSNDYFQYILAVSFTKEATNEMKERILAELYGLAMNTVDSTVFLDSLKELLWEEKKKWKEKTIRAKAKQIFFTMLHKYSQLHITTIDSFFQRIVHNLACELGQSSSFDLEMNTQQVLQEAVNQVIEKASPNSQILKWLILYAEHLLDEGKSFRMKESLETFGKCIYNEFFQEHNKKLPNCLEFFSQLEKKQHQIQEKGKLFFVSTYEKVICFLKQYGLDETDFIRKGIPIIFFKKTAQGNYSKKNVTIEKCCIDKEAWVTKTHKKREMILFLTKEKLMPLLNIVLTELRKVRTAQMIANHLYQLGLVKEIVREIEEQNHEKNRFILPDMNVFLSQMIDKSDTSFIYEKIGKQIKHVMIDEFQDTSRMQWKNFHMLLNEIKEKNSFSLIMGDEKQSIYRWRNSDWRILHGVAKELDAEKKRLPNNWRSKKHIVDFNNMFFPLAAKILQNELGNTTFPAYRKEKVMQKTNKCAIGGYVSIHLIQESERNRTIYKEKMLEAVLNQVKELYKIGIPTRDICLLVRENKIIKWIAEYFSSKNKDYPKMASENYLTLLSNEAFYLKNSLAIKIIITSLEIIAYPSNPIYQKKLIYWLEIGQLTQNIQGIDNSLLSFSLFDLIGHICRRFKLEQIVGQSAYLFAFYDYLIYYSNKHLSTVYHFLECWEKEGKNKTLPTGTGLEGIQAMTIHRAKGLQFSTVIIPFCDWKLTPEKNPLLWCQWKGNESSFPLLPITYKKEMRETIFTKDYETETTQSYIDNLNLLYVAFTRAKKNLMILGKYKKEIKEIKSVSDLLQKILYQVKDNKNEVSNHFEIGTISSTSIVPKPVFADNPLKQLPTVKEIPFFPLGDYLNNLIFKQFNQSIKKETFLMDYGNIMHAIFSEIENMGDIRNAIEKGILQGWFPPECKKFYTEKIKNAIDKSNVKAWFSGNYITYREYSILTEENGTVVNKRPDRVLFSKEKTIVIDYKFGEPHHKHKKQLKQYINLLKEMNAPNVEGYLWYVENNEVKPILI